MRVEAGKCPHETLIYLDDIKQKFVLIADDEAGMVKKIAVDENGKPKTNETKNGFLTETLHGKVTIVLPDTKNDTAVPSQ